MSSLEASPHSLRSGNKGGAPGVSRRRVTEILWCYAFILPFLFFFVGLTIWPILGTIVYSFNKLDAFGQIQKFVGLANFRTVLADTTFYKSIVNAVFFTVANTAIKLPLSLFLAILLTRKWLKGTILARTGFFLPLVIPGAIIGMIFTFLLNPANGSVNALLMQLHLVTRPIDFTGSRWMGMSTMVVISVWGVLGTYMIYWMAAIQSIPEEMYEAAEIDGANEWQQLIYITLPMIRPIATIILFLGLVGAVQVFDLVLTLTGGGPGNETYTIAYYIYQRGFTASPPNIGVASAASVIFGFATLIIVSLQGYFVSRSQNEQQEKTTKAAYVSSRG